MLGAWKYDFCNMKFSILLSQVVCFIVDVGGQSVENGLRSGQEEVEHGKEEIEQEGDRDACKAGLILEDVDTEQGADLAEYQGEKNETVDERSQFILLATTTYKGIIKALGARGWPITGLCIPCLSMA